MKKVFAVVDTSYMDSYSSKSWTISEDPRQLGWKACSEETNRGLTKEQAEFYAKCINFCIENNIFEGPAISEMKQYIDDRTYALNKRIYSIETDIQKIHKQIWQFKELFNIEQVEQIVQKAVRQKTLDIAKYFSGIIIDERLAKATGLSLEEIQELRNSK